VSFVKQQVVLPKSNPTSSNAMRVCGRCDKERVPEGGITMGGKWVCAVCWVQRTRKNR
jgi:hypothetical protein